MIKLIHLVVNISAALLKLENTERENVTITHSYKHTHTNIHCTHAG